jgi:hypothetical protein
MSLLGFGCASIKAYPDRSVTVRHQLSALSWCFDEEKIKKDPSDKESPDWRTNWRDEVVNCRIRAIDLQFTSFEQSLSRENVSLNAVVDMAALGLGGATAIAAGSGTKAVLGAISGGLIGAKGIIDKDVFYSKTMPALLAQMEAQRKTQLVRIRTGLKSSADKYPLSEALIDVEEYYKAGSIPSAVQGIIEQSGATAQEQTAQLRKLLPATAAQVKAKAALTEAIKSLGPSSDLGKLNQAITKLDPKATPAGTVEEAAQKLQKIVRDTDAGDQTRMDTVTHEFETAGILK